MKEGLEEFLKRIEAKPTNETLIDRFVTLVLEEDIHERILYLKKLVGLLLAPNPYAALKAAALELQEVTKEKLSKEYEIGALKDVESCFIKLEKAENAVLVREEINKLQNDLMRENTALRTRTMPPQVPRDMSVSDTYAEDAASQRQARLHIRLPAEADGDEIDGHERTVRNRLPEAEAPFPSPPPKTVPFMPDAPPEFALASAGDDPFDARSGPKEFYDKSFEEDEEPVEATKRTMGSNLSGIKVGPNLLDTPEDREPEKHRNLQTVFDSTDMQDAESPRSGMEYPASKPRAPGSGFGLEEAGASQDLFDEGQQLHFPEATTNRSMSRQQLRPHAGPDNGASPKTSGKAADRTEILPESRLMSTALPFGDDDESEATVQFDPEELARAAAPHSPPLSPRDLEMPVFDESALTIGQPTRSSRSRGKDAQAPVKLDIFTAGRHPEAAPAPQPAGWEQTELLPREAAAPRRESPASFAIPMDAPTQSSPRDALAPKRDSSQGMQELLGSSREPQVPPREAIPLPKEGGPLTTVSAPAALSAIAGHRPSPPPPIEPRWSLLRERLRQLSGIQVSRNHSHDFIVRLLGEQSSRQEQQFALGILIRLLESSRPTAEQQQQLLALLFEEVPPKALHQLLGALKMGDQTVSFLVEYLKQLVKERQLRRTLNIIHAVIIPGLDLGWYQEAYRFLLIVWPELGLKGWNWLEEEGPMIFCDRLAEREDILPATLLG